MNYHPNSGIVANGSTYLSEVTQKDHPICLNQKFEEIKIRPVIFGQSTNERVVLLVQVLKRMIADESNLGVDDPEERERTDTIFLTMSQL
jgi:hypothetical protein